MAPLEKALFAVPSKDRNSSIVARHYGFDGKGGANFQKIGNEFDLTRERVRQIVSEADPLSHLLQKGYPLLDRIITTIAAGLPAPAALVESRLQQTGFSTKPFRIEGILNAARLLSRPVPFRLNSLSKARYIVPTAYPPFSEIITEARQEVRKNGMTTISQFLMGRPGSDEAQRESALLESVMSTQRDFRWLDKKSGWFWLAATPRNCAVSRIRKMLAVANPLPVVEVRAGLERMEGPLAPEKTLLEFCRQIPGITVEGETVRATPEIEAVDCAKLLRGTKTANSATTSATLP